MPQNNVNVSIESFLSSIHTLSIQQIEKLKEGVKNAINDNENMLMGILEHYIKDEEIELNKIKRIIKRWNNAKNIW